MPPIRSCLSLASALLATALMTLPLSAQPADPTPPTTVTPPPATVPAPATTTPGIPARTATAVVKPANEAKIDIKFGEITVDAALELLETWTGRTVIRPGGLPATSLAFNSKQKLTRAEATQALETLLTMNGIAVTPLGDKFLKVTPLNTARTEAPDFIDGSTLGLPASGHIASKLFQLKFLRVSEFAPQISSLLNVAAASPPVLFEKSNAALVTDTVSNLQRIEMLLTQVDQPSLGGMKPKFYKVHSTTASELVTKLQSILSGNAATQLGTATSFQADDRTNQIILLSDERQHAFFDDLIERLDTAGESSTRQEVIVLKHANATEMQTLLSTLISGQNAASKAANQTSQNQNGLRGAIANLVNARTTGNNAANGAPGQGGNQANAAVQGGNGNNANRGNGNTNNGNRGNAPFSVTAGPNGNIVINGGAASAPQQFSDILTIVADERSNALVVSGTVDDMRLIKDLIDQLDVLLAQVRIEVIIAEVTLSDQSTTGIDALGLIIQADKVVGFYGSGAGFNAGNATTPFTLVDATTGAKDLSGTLGLTTTPRKSNVNILSAPNIVTSHNKEASLFVGEKRPVISSYINSGNNTGNVGSGYTSNITQTEIGITLTVKPLIGHDGSVQLEIDQKVDDVLDTVLIDGNSQPVIGSRTATSFVSAKTGEIVVLGGLQRKTQSRSTSRLGGIPIIGDLLGTRKRESSRTDLVFFLRPYILTNTEADNAEALKRLETSPQKKDVDATLKGALPVKS